MNAAPLRKIIDSKKTCYFISPHYDDAVLSAGALAGHLKATNRIVIINIFTKAGPRPYTLSAKAYLRQCHYTDAEKLYADRTKEDKNALSSIADEVIDLGFRDALWRSRKGSILKHLGRLLPELSAVYPTYRFHIVKGKVARADIRMVTEIKTKLTKIVEPKNSIVFCPLGVGNHIDHVIARIACDELFSNSLHWADYPYSLNNENGAKTKGMKSFLFEQEKAAKSELIKKYSSQYKALFPDTLQLQSELFYYK